ncbi:MAG TPA: hypothetical protein VFK30_15005, partial [Anaerolineae bacterium]|nr:hypothetical protein [Anaerolineae bacterium]
GLLNHIDLIAIWRTALSIHLELDRSYLIWLFFQPYDFFVFMGLPLFVWWAARTFTALREARARLKPIDVLALTFICAFILLAISNTSRGETARVWSFLLPLPLLIGVNRFPRKSIVFMSLIGLISLQVFISNIFLRTVGTGLSDPPAAPPAIEVGPQPIVAAWQGGPILQSIDFPSSASAGQSLSIQTVWTTAQQIDRPYTLFIHLVDPQGQIIAQYDGMALNNTWPTTCWRRTESFADAYTLTLPEQLSASAYRVELGFYWLVSGERLVLTQPGGDVITVGSIEIH